MVGPGGEFGSARLSVQFGADTVRICSCMATLAQSQHRTLSAAIDRMIPEDDFPSASQAGCLEFLLRLIDLEGLMPVYLAGIADIESHSAQFGAAFAELSPEMQDQVLTMANQEFVQLLARQTIEGYYADPGNGGNRDGVAWEMIGFKVTA